MTITKSSLEKYFINIPGSRVETVVVEANKIWNNEKLTREMIYAICYILLTKE